MKKKPINHCAVCVLIESGGAKEFLFNIYDNTFPIKIWQNKINLIGGGKLAQDDSPYFAVKREVNEEFSSTKNVELDTAYKETLKSGSYDLPQIGKMASEKDIIDVKSQILKNLGPYQDFIITLPTTDDNLKMKFRDIIFSIFYSKLSKDTFDIIKKNLKDGRSLVNDSFLRIANLEEITSGKILTAWSTGKVLEDYLHQSLPDPIGIQSEKIGKPRNLYKEYLNNFDFHIF